MCRRRRALGARRGPWDAASRLRRGDAPNPGAGLPGGAGGYPGAARAVYACKANATVGLLRILLDEGMGMDVASEGELAHALAAGAPGELLVVHGNNKSDADVRAAVAAEAGLLVVDHRRGARPGRADRGEPGRIQPILLRVTPGHRRRDAREDPNGARVVEVRDRPRRGQPRDRARRSLPAPAPRRAARAPRLPDPRPRHLRPGGRRGSPGSRGSPSCPCSTSAAASPSLHRR